MDVREKLVELLEELCVDYGAAAIFFTSEEAEVLADHLIANGVTVSEGTLPVADGVTERSAVVDKIEEKRKPEDFIGYRKPEQEWISVKDRLPKPFTPVLVYRKSFGTLPPYIKVDKMILEYDDTQVWTDEVGNWKNVTTYWMPLPQPPKGE